MDTLSLSFTCSYNSCWSTFVGRNSKHLSKPHSSRQRFETYQTERRNRSNPAVDDTSNRFTGSDKKHRSAAVLVREFMKLARGQGWSILFAIVTVTFTTALALIPPAGTKVLVDYVLGDKPLPSRWAELGLPVDRWKLLQLGVVGLLVVTLVKSLIDIWGSWHATKAAKRVQLSVRRRLFDHTIRLRLHQVYELKSGGAASILRQDANGVGDLVFAMFYNPSRALVQLIGSLLILAWVDWKLLIVSLLVIPLIYFTHRTWIGRIRPLHRDVRTLRKSIDALATEVFGGMRVVRGFGRQRSESNRYMREGHLMARQELYIWRSTRFIRLVWTIFTPLAVAALLLYGGSQVLQGSLTLGDLMMFVVYALMLLDPLAVLAQSAATFQSGLSALERVLDILGEPQEFESSSKSQTVQTSSARGQIEFENVSFRYPRCTEYALANINLVVEPGMVVALAGQSGAGKTTLCNLIARFYEPTVGRILLDGVDIRELDVESYRMLLGIVDQDVFLFDGSVAENINYARNNAEFDDVLRAAELSNADEFILNLPNGYDTVIGERGVRLSGGQRQRLAIARAILADPRILILDEATSNLDTRSERMIQQGLSTLIADRTTFVIAHRLSTITHADQIVVLEDGKITDVGTHDELLAAGGRFSAMLNVQFGLE